MIKKAFPFIVLGSILTAQVQVQAADSDGQPLFHRMTIPADNATDSDVTEQKSDSSKETADAAKVEQTTAPETSPEPVKETPVSPLAKLAAAESAEVKAEAEVKSDRAEKNDAEKNSEDSRVAEKTVETESKVEVAAVAAQATDSEAKSDKLFKSFDQAVLAEKPAKTTTTGHRNVVHELVDSKKSDSSKKSSAVSKSRAVQRAVSYTVRGKRYTTLADSDGFVQTGRASWYGKRFHGRKTASGEVFDMNALTAAHKELPLGSKIEVTNNANGKKIVVTVNDRGPFHGNRVLDLSKAAAERLGVIKAGTADVTIRAL